MVEYFKDIIVNHFKDVNQLVLSASKQIEAKEISIRELKIIQKDYELTLLNSDITFTDKTPCIEVSREIFEIWKRN